MRKNLKLDTTYINRANSNDYVFRTVNQKIKEGGKKKEVVKFTEAYESAKRKRATNIIKQRNSPIFKISFNGNRLRKWIFANRRVGRPRMNWTEETVREIWNHIKKNDDRYRYKAFDGDNDDIINNIFEYAENQ